MLYDEPTTGLDPITSREISELILQMQKKYKTTSIIITHDMECASITADRIVVMNDGEYIAEGTFDELKKSKDEFVRSFFKNNYENHFGTKNKNRRIYTGGICRAGIGHFFYREQEKTIFNSTFNVHGMFKNVNGLQVGNNARFAGINVGVVAGY